MSYIYAFAYRLLLLFYIFVRWGCSHRFPLSSDYARIFSTRREDALECRASISCPARALLSFAHSGVCPLMSACTRLHACSDFAAFFVVSAEVVRGGDAWRCVVCVMACLKVTLEQVGGLPLKALLHGFMLLNLF